MNGQGCVDIVAQDFNDILLFQWTMEFNSAVATYSHVNIVNLPDTIFTSQPRGPDLITVSWQSANFSGINVPDCEVLFQVCFDAVGQNGDQTPLSFTGSSTNIEVRDEIGTLLNPDFFPGTLTIDSNAKPPFSLQIQGGQLEENQSTCLAVNANGLNDVTNLTTSHSWNPNVLQLDQINGFNLPGLDVSDFTINASAGTAVLNWSSNSSSGETVPDGTNIYDLCFTAIGSPGQSSAVSITDSPTISSATDASGDNLTFNLSSTNVSITSPPGACGSINGLSFYASSETVETNGNVCVSVSAQDFENIISFQWTMFYDSTIIDLESATAVSLPVGSFSFMRNTFSPQVGIPGPSQISPNQQYPAGTNKLIIISWVDPSVSGFTLNQDCETLFNLCFDAIGNGGQTSPIVFSDSPSNVEVADGNENVILNNDGPFEDGRIDIKTSCSGPAPPAPAVPLPSNVNIVNVNCRGDNTGSIDLTFDQNIAGLTFMWTPGNVSTMDLPNVTAGNYSLNISNGSRDTTLTYTINEPQNALNGSVGDVIQVRCNGSSDGAISIVTSGGTAGYTYDWSGLLPDGPTVQNNLAVGSYSVTVMDANGCTDVVGPIQINEPQAIQIAETITDVDCAGRSNGRIVLSPSGGTTGGQGFSYNWTPTRPPTATQNNIPAGNYSVTVTDSNQCTATESFTVGSATPIDISLVGISGEANGNDGEIDIEVSGGELNGLPNYVYIWTPTSPLQQTQDATNLAAGQYTVSVTDGTLCSATATFTVDFVGPAFMTGAVVVEDACVDSSNGAITVNFTGGINPQITWSSPTSPAPGPVFNPTGLEPGLYNYIITDQGVQVDDGSEIVGIHRNLIITAASIRDEVNGNDGRIDLDPLNGVGPYTFAWSNNGFSLGGNEPFLDNLQAGTYDVLVTDLGTGCSNTATFTVEDRRPVSLGQLDVTDSNCPEAASGEVCFEVTQGVSNFTILITGPNGFVPRNETRTTPAPFTFCTTNLPEGDFVVTVTDANTSVITRSFTINEPDPFSVIPTIIPQVGTNNGSIDLAINGGTPPYTENFGNGINPNNLPAGNYSAIVTDANGCTFTTAVYEVTRFRIIDTDIVDASCEDASNGSISITVDGGNRPYTYIWEDASGGDISTNASVSNVPPGPYTVTVIGALGTRITETFIVGEQSSITSTSTVTTNFGGFNVSCNGGNDGRARIDPANGQAPYTFEWEDGQTTQEAIDLPGGISTVTVTDDVGCTSITEVILTQPTAITAREINRGVNCFGDADGEIQLFVDGGVQYQTALGYIFLWDEPSFPNGTTIRNVQAGVYPVTIEDANGCQVMRDVVVDGPTGELVADVVTTPADDNCNGSTRLEVTGGTQPYFYDWFNRIEADSSDRELFGLCSGTYVAEITDANGCTTVASGTVGNTSIECLTARAVMTPDGGGLNEEFIIWCIEQFPNNTLEIYNRWGQLVWEQDNYDNTWAGRTIRGAEVPDGAYFYVFRYNIDNEVKQSKGSFTLLRE